MPCPQAATPAAEQGISRNNLAFGDYLRFILSLRPALASSNFPPLSEQISLFTSTPNHTTLDRRTYLALFFLSQVFPYSTRLENCGQSLCIGPLFLNRIHTLFPR
jgi:hypothetical protein